MPFSPGVASPWQRLFQNPSKGKIQLLVSPQDSLMRCTEPTTMNALTHTSCGEPWPEVVFENPSEGQIQLLVSPLDPFTPPP